MIIPHLEKTNIMKAIYQKPITEAIAADTSDLMATSLFTTNGDGTISQELSEEHTTNQQSGNLSRTNLWDDDEDI